MTADRFVRGTERLSNPITAGSIHFLQQFFGMLPRGIQRRMLERSTQTAPYMGFVVDPYALFLFFEVDDEARAASLLPKGFRLARTRAFVGDEPACLAVVSLFRVHTSAFFGARAEFYLIAEDETTGLLSWVIIDYLSDTVSYDRAHGLRAPSAQGAVVTTTADGRVIADMRADDDGRGLAASARLAGATMRRLDERLWIEGNLSVAYGPGLSPDDASTFSLTFPAEEMTEALEIPTEALSLEHMSWYDDLLKPVPTRVACFPFAQHLLSDSPGTASRYASARELAERVRTIDLDALPTFSTASTKRGIVVGTIASFAVTVALAAALVLG